MAFTLKELIYTLNKIEKKLNDNKKFLNTIDEKIGDGDHGSEISNGFKFASFLINNKKFNDWQEIFKFVGKNIISNGKGRGSVLYGNAFIKSSIVGLGKKEITLVDLRDILYKSIEAIKERGHCEKGDKTILDGLIPIYEEINYGINNGLAVENTLLNAINYSREEVEKTRLLISKKGRASYLGEKSIGYQDPGATSALIIFEAIYDSYKELRIYKKTS